MTSISLSTFRYDSAAGPGPSRYASPARRTCWDSRSASEYTATDGMPSSSSARITRTAISPRFATSTFENIGRVMLPPDRLILVRHGESTWNAEERLQGQLDPPLSERGREQSRALARIVNGIPDERVVCSDLTRARETAELIGLRPGRLDPLWREIDVGSWGGRTAAEIDAQGGALTNWRGGPAAGGPRESRGPVPRPRGAARRRA